MSAPVLSFVALGAGSLALGLILGAACSRLAPEDRSGVSVGRKAFHIAVFTGAVPAQLWLGLGGVVLYGTLMASLVLLGYARGRSSSLYRALARPGEGDGKGRELLLPLAATAAGGLLSVLLVGRFAVVGYLVCGWGDGAGALVGRRWGRGEYCSPFARGSGSIRTLAGSAGVLGAGSLGAGSALGLLGFPILAAAGIGILVGFVGAVAEGLSPRETDNLWAQIIPSLTAWWFLG